MQYPKSIPVAVALIIVVPAMALAADVKVIANASVTASTISARDLKSVFLGEKARWMAPMSCQFLKRAGRLTKPS